jgi:hypothetical protein
MQMGGCSSYDWSGSQSSQGTNGRVFRAGRRWLCCGGLAVGGMALRTRNIAKFTLKLSVTGPISHNPVCIHIQLMQAESPTGQSGDGLLLGEEGDS